MAGFPKAVEVVDHWLCPPSLAIAGPQRSPGPSIRPGEPWMKTMNRNEKCKSLKHHDFPNVTNMGSPYFERQKSGDVRRGSSASKRLKKPEEPVQPRHSPVQVGLEASKSPRRLRNAEQIEAERALAQEQQPLALKASQCCLTVSPVQSLCSAGNGFCLELSRLTMASATSDGGGGGKDSIRMEFDASNELLQRRLKTSLKGEPCLAMSCPPGIHNLHSTVVLHAESRACELHENI